MADGMRILNLFNRDRSFWPIVSLFISLSSTSNAPYIISGRSVSMTPQAEFYELAKTEQEISHLQSIYNLTRVTVSPTHAAFQPGWPEALFGVLEMLIFVVGFLGWNREWKQSGAVFRIADHVRTDISDRPLWTMLLSGPNLFQNATSASRQSISHVAKETFPNLVSRSVQMASNPKTVHPNQWLKCHVHVQTDQKVVWTSNSEH